MRSWFRRVSTARPAVGSDHGAEAAAQAIRLLDLSVAYPGREALSGISGRFAPGQLTAIVGPNGAGKSTLLAALMGRVRPNAGAVLMPAGLRERLAWLPQQAQVERSVPLCVADVVALGLWRELGAFGGLNARQRERVAQALQTVGLAQAAQWPVAALSAGQFQRMLFARVLVQDAAVVLLDEPFNAVDEPTAAALLAIVRRWRDEGRTVIAVLHDLQMVRELCDEVLWLDRRCLAWGPTAQVLDARSLAGTDAPADVLSLAPDLAADLTEDSPEHPFLHAPASADARAAALLPAHGRARGDVAAAARRG